ncbi:hypothetical protein CYMTET_39209 [Cymbomonas tetramitiformis]|uniref:Amino acid transporter transmembrane domain-containing protein n=1 Tax=Cymbomonas tetramitiformis TaxID=36881 RepID=A0AAE0F4H5_9CHLO|nr:hypothetical protein CYMTET_39209 [Cymbomonas tetramitiformis]
MLTGAGFLALPRMYQESGWILGISFTVLFTGITAFSCDAFAKACYIYKRNDGPQLKELTSSAAEDQIVLNAGKMLANITGPTHHSAFLSLGTAALTFLNVSAIREVSRALDDIFVLLFGNSGGLTLYPTFEFVASCTKSDSAPGDCDGSDLFHDAYDNGAVIITAGYCLLCAACIVLCSFRINDTMQKWMYYISLFCLIEVIIGVSCIGWEGNITPFGSGNFGMILEVQFFTFAIGFVIPVWLSTPGIMECSEKDTFPPIRDACVSRGIQFTVFGMMMALTFKDIDTMSAINLVLDRDNDVDPLTQLCAFILLATAILPNILSYTITVKDNLEEDFGSDFANGAAFVLPWCSAFLVYFGGSYEPVVNWSSILLSSYMNFLIPLWLFLMYARSDTVVTYKVADMRQPRLTWLSIVHWVGVLICVFVIVGGLQGPADVGFGPGRAL